MKSIVGELRVVGATDRQRQQEYLAKSNKVTSEDVAHWPTTRRLWNNTIAMRAQVAHTACNWQPALTCVGEIDRGSLDCVKTAAGRDTGGTPTQRINSIFAVARSDRGAQSKRPQW